MEKKEFEIVLETVLAAVREQLIEHLLLAMHSIAVMACSDQEAKEKLAEALKMQALTCPDDVFGRHYLEWLSEMLFSPVSTDPATPHKSLRTSLRLIQGKDQKRP